LDEKRIYFLVAASCFTLSIGIHTSRLCTDSNNESTLTAKAEKDKKGMNTALIPSPHFPEPLYQHQSNPFQRRRGRPKLTMGSFLSKTASKLSHPEKPSTMSPATFTHFAGAQTTFNPPLIANENAYLGDIASSEPNDPTAPISAGFYRLEKGTPLVYTYTYHEMKIIVDGEFDISDETGKKVHAVKGDVFYCKLRPRGRKYSRKEENSVLIRCS